jgi:hypothetical protein
MTAALRLATTVVVATAGLLPACTLNVLGKDACGTTNDCINGYVCVSNHCVPPGAGGNSGGGGNGGNMTDGGTDRLPPSMCPADLVTACPAADGGTSCEETFCGGRIWQNGLMKSVLVRYQIKDPQAMFSPSYRGAIRAGAMAWNRASGGFVTFQECINCMGRFISVVPGDGDGITNPDDAEQLLPMPVVSSVGRVSPHRIAHQWGHVVGLSHTYQRADRDRYVRFDPALWCQQSSSALPPRCAAGPASPSQGLPAVTSGTFGVFDGKSKMNGFHSDGICGAEQPDEDSGEPTIGDLSAAAELFFGATTFWSPFRPIGRSVSPTEPFDYQLAPGVDPTGSPAIAELQPASPEIFVRGTDDRVYATTRLDPLTSSSADWHDWAFVAEDVDTDPAVVFAVNALSAETLFLAVRSGLDGSIQLRSRRAGTWGGWTSLAAPPSGAASAPALASETPSSLAVVVRGGDGLIYWLHCQDADQDCAASASDPSAWQALPPPSSGVFVGKPSAVWLRDSTGLAVAAIRDDRAALLITGIDNSISDWATVANVNTDLGPDDPDPGVAITITSTPQDVGFFARNRQGLLLNDTLQSKSFPIGGVLASPPGAVGTYNGSIRTDVAAIIEDHGHPGVWWRFNDANYVAPCNYNRPGTCQQCGL